MVSYRYGCDPRPDPSTYGRVTRTSGRADLNRRGNGSTKRRRPTHILSPRQLQAVANGQAHRSDRSPIPSSALVPSPKAIPARSPAALNHRAAYIARSGRNTPRTRAITSSTASRGAAHCRPRNKDVTVRADALPPSQQRYKGVTRCNRICVRTGVSRRTAPIQLSCSDARNTKTWSFRAPNRAIPIPYMGRRAFERCPGRHHRDLSCKQECGEHHSSFSTSGFGRTRIAAPSVGGTCPDSPTLVALGSAARALWTEIGIK